MRFFKTTVHGAWLLAIGVSILGLAVMAKQVQAADSTLGVSVAVVSGSGGDIGSATLTGLIDAFAVGGFEQRGQEADRGALACSVGTDEAEHFSGFDLKVEPLDRSEIAVVFAKVGQFDHG